MVTFLTAGPVGAGHNMDRHPDGSPRIEFHFDKEPSADRHMTEYLAVGASIELEIEAEIDFDLDRSADEDVVNLTPTLTLQAVYEPSRNFRAFAEVELERELVIEDPDGDQGEIKLEVKEAGLTFYDVVDGVTITLGRWDVSDDREWLMDTELDGIQFVWRPGDVAFEAAYYREEIARSDLAGEHDTDEPDLFYLRGYAALGDDSLASAYVLFQNGRRRDRADDLVWLGISSYGDLGGGFDYWAEAALVVGSEDGRQVRGHGFDIGVTKGFRDLPGRPYLTAGVAFGSGDDGRGTDTAFRQTGLHGNDDKFGGVTSLAYYGEVLDPELSNLAILTLGAGVRPTPRSSVDLVYHRYIQPTRSDEFRDVEIDPDPTGLSRDIGDEFDLVIGIREWRNVDIELVGGVFLPGSVFAEDDPAYFFSASIEIDF